MAPFRSFSFPSFLLNTSKKLARFAEASILPVRYDHLKFAEGQVYLLDLSFNERIDNKLAHSQFKREELKINIPVNMKFFTATYDLYTWVNSVYGAYGHPIELKYLSNTRAFKANEPFLYMGKKTVQVVAPSFIIETKPIEERKMKDLMVHMFLSSSGEVVYVSKDVQLSLASSGAGSRLVSEIASEFDELNTSDKLSTRLLDRFISVK